MRARALAVTTLFAVVALRGAVACVEGVTPDCSNPAVCAPSEGPLGAVDAATTIDAADASTDAANASDARPADAADGG